MRVREDSPAHLPCREAVPKMSGVVAGPIPSLKFEREAWRAGAFWVAGVDEVGVGPLAGPVTAGVVALPPRRRPPGPAPGADSIGCSVCHSVGHSIGR